MRGERGFALVITLIVTALLVALLVEFVNQTYVDTSHSHNFVASQQAGLLAESGAVAARRLLEFEPGMQHPEYSSLQDSWAKPQVFEDETGTLTVTIEEESGKLNLNTITYETAVHQTFYPVAQNLMKKLNLSTDLAAAVADWESKADLPPQTNGAKSPYYNGLKPPYDVKGGKLESVDELGLVKGFTPEVLTRLKGYLTVYGSVTGEVETKVNLNTAPRELIAALDEKLSHDLVSRILDYRKTKPIKSFGDVTGLEALASSLSRVANFRGSVYRIRSEGRVKESLSVVEAVIRLKGSQSEILYWREY